MTSAIYIIYNAKASITGKLNYVYRKLRTPQNACAACDLTHGGLSLSETDKWKETKKQINADVKQLHTDELDKETVDFASANALKYPVVLGKSAPPTSPLVLLMTSDDIASCGGDHSRFLKVLHSKAEEKGVNIGTASSR